MDIIAHPKLAFNRFSKNFTILLTIAVSIQVGTYSAPWLTLNPKKTEIAHFDAGVEFLGHIFDRDGCYQPIPEPRTKVLQKQVHRALKTGAVHVKRSGQHVTQHGKNVAAHIGQRLKNGKPVA